MSHYTRTPRMVNPRLVPQPSPVVYAPVSTSSPYYHEPATLGRRQSMGSYLPGPQIYHVAASDPSHSRSHHRSSSKSRKHRRSHSTDRHSGSRHHRHHRRSSTPSRSMSTRYSPETQYAAIPSGRHRRHSVHEHHYRASSREPRGAIHPSHREHHYMSHHRESIGARIKRFFGIGTHKVRFVDSSGHQVDRLGRPIYAM